MIGKSVVTIVYLAIAGFLGLSLVSQAEVAPRVFYGNREFVSVDDALEFQRQVVTYTTDIGGTVNECDIKVQSPPIVTYQLVAPAQEYSIWGDKPIQFNYGKPTSSMSIWTLRFGAIVIWAFGLLAIVMIWLRN